MRGWLVIHNHFFANTADISHRSSTSEMGVLQEFPISWRGVPEMVLSGSRGGGFTYVRGWAPAVSLLCSKPFLGLQAVCPGEEASTALLEDASCPLRLSWCPLKVSSGPFRTANPSYMRRTWEEGLLHFCFLLLEVQDLVIQQVITLFPTDVWGIAGYI